MIDFGYLFCRVMAAYGLSDTHLLGMPLKRFWLLEKNVSRLNAERELRQIPIVLAPNAQNGVRDITERLSAELGSVMTVNVAERDPDALVKLKRLAG